MNLKVLENGFFGSSGSLTLHQMKTQNISAFKLIMRLLLSLSGLRNLNVKKPVGYVKKQGFLDCIKLCYG